MKKILLLLTALLLALTAPVLAQNAGGGSTRITAEVPREHRIEVVYNSGGQIKSGGSRVESGGAVTTPRHQNVVLDLSPEMGWELFSLKRDGVDVTDSLNGNMLVLSDVTADTALAASYVPADIADYAARHFRLSGEVRYTDGTPCGSQPLELHSDVLYTRTNTSGRFVFEGAAPGAHTLYAKDAEGRVLGQASFRVDRTASESGSRVVNLPDGTVEILLNADAVNLYLVFLLGDDGLLTILSAQASGTLPEREEKMDGPVHFNPSTGLLSGPATPACAAGLLVLLAGSALWIMRKKASKE